MLLNQVMNMNLSDANQKILQRATAELNSNMLVNLGIGLPQMIAGLLDKDNLPVFLSENGLIGVDSPVSYEQANPYCIDAGGEYVGVVKGGAFVDSAFSFGLIRRGLIDVSFLGAFQVASNGDLANWHVPGTKKMGMGGALEIASCAKKIVILMRHTDKFGRSKIVNDCTFPITARACVDRIITEQAVFDITLDGMVLKEIADGLEVSMIKTNTDADFTVDANLRVF